MDPGGGGTTHRVWHDGKLYSNKILQHRNAQSRWVCVCICFLYMLSRACKTRIRSQLDEHKRARARDEQ